MERSVKYIRNIINTLLISYISVIITGFLTNITVSKKAKNEIIKMKKSNKHEVEKLMKQHKTDIEHVPLEI